MTEHQPQFPQPLELPIDERESPLGLRAQLVRFVITGGLSAIVDFGLLVILMHGFFGFDGLGHTPAKALSVIASNSRLNRPTWRAKVTAYSTTTPKKRRLDGSARKVQRRLIKYAVVVPAMKDKALAGVCPRPS